MKVQPINIGEIVKDNLTMTVELQATGVRWFAFRCWLGGSIMRVAAWVIGCRIEIKGDE